MSCGACATRLKWEPFFGFDPDQVRLFGAGAKRYALERRVIE
jgi:hypothetical protein